MTRVRGVVAIVVTLTLAAGTAAASSEVPLTPELAAKRETARKQEAQRVTNEKRKAAAEALKAERLRVDKARKEVQQMNPGSSGSK